MDREILLADDEVTFRETLAKVLREEDMSVTVVGNGTDAIDAVMRQPFGVVILDIRMPGIDGIGVLREIMRIRPETRVIMITAYGTVEMAVEAIKLGACDYVMKPVVMDDIVTKIRQNMKYLDLQDENKQLKHELGKRFDISQIVGKSASMQSVFDMIRKVAPTKSNVLITGKSGTGKELVARAIHSLAAKNSRHFLAVNCSAIPEGLLESELFGHKKGSFTSAIRDKRDRSHADELPGQAAQGGRAQADHTGRLHRTCRYRSAACSGHQQGPAERDQSRTVSRGSVLQDERRRNPSASVARQKRRYTPAGRALHKEV
jgi:two-component system response regulator PilR (NtrC family)